MHVLDIAVEFQSNGHHDKAVPFSNDIVYTIVHSEITQKAIKEHVVGTLFWEPKETVGVYTTVALRPGLKDIQGSQWNDIDLHTERLVRSISSVIHRSAGSGPEESIEYGNSLFMTEESRARDFFFYDQVRDHVHWCLNLAHDVIRDENTMSKYMVVIVFQVPKARPFVKSGSFLGIQKILVYVKACSPRSGSSSSNANIAYILGPPRSNPDVKDILWMMEREYLERLAPVDATEVLLCSQSGDVLEGLVTNVFVVVENAGELVVQTAPICNGVLWGTMRRRVIDACRKLSIPLIYQSPSMSVHHTWKEAFVTNSIRGVVQLDAIVCDKNNVWGLPAWHVTFKSCTVGAQISQYLSQC